MGFENKQLFIKEPDNIIINMIIKCFNLENLQDTSEFSDIEMTQTNVIGKFLNIKKNLLQYYLPCKAKTYLDIKTNKNCITIARQFLKINRHNLTSKEKYHLKKKTLYYFIEPKCNKEFREKVKEEKRKLEENKKIIITFD
jgi:hypothetical protein